MISARGVWATDRVVRVQAPQAGDSWRNRCATRLDLARVPGAALPQAVTRVMGPTAFGQPGGPEFMVRVTVTAAASSPPGLSARSCSTSATGDRPPPSRVPRTNGELIEGRQRWKTSTVETGVAVAQLHRSRHTGFPADFKSSRATQQLGFQRGWLMWTSGPQRRLSP